MFDILHRLFGRLWSIWTGGKLAIVSAPSDRGSIWTDLGFLRTGLRAWASGRFIVHTIDEGDNTKHDQSNSTQGHSHSYDICDKNDCRFCDFGLHVTHMTTL